jgi:hypothetical protein
MRRLALVSLVLLLAAIALFAASPKQHYLATVILPDTSSQQAVQQLEIGIESITPASAIDDLGAILGDGNNQDALLHKFETMKRSGWVSMAGRPSVDVKIVLEKKTPKGREITLLTDRPISYWEALNSPITRSYPYGIMKFTVNDKGDGQGKIYPIVRIKKMSGDQISIDDYGVIPLDVPSVHSIK